MKTTSILVRMPQSLVVALATAATSRHQTVEGLLVDLAREAAVRFDNGEPAALGFFGPLLNRPDENIRYRAKELAGAMKVKHQFVKSMRAAGFEMPGYTATVADAKRWLDEHPNFVPHQARMARKKGTGSSGAARPNHPLEGANKLDELSLRHG